MPDVAPELVLRVLPSGHQQRLGEPHLQRRPGVAVHRRELVHDARASPLHEPAREAAQNFRVRLAIEPLAQEVPAFGIERVAERVARIDAHSRLGMRDVLADGRARERLEIDGRLWLWGWRRSSGGRQRRSHPEHQDEQSFERHEHDRPSSATGRGGGDL